MKIVKLSRKFVLIVIGTIFSLSIFAQSPEKEKRIYLLDLTGSMEGRGTGVTYDILSTVKNNLSSTLDGIEDQNTEVVIIPFTNIPHEAIHSFVSEKDVLHKFVEKIKVLPGDTNIADAWEEGLKNLDSTKVNYMFLLTDGLHNTGPSKDVLFERLNNWQNLSSGHYYYAFYVMLTPNAKEMEICSIVDSTTNMWLIESMDINASLIKTSINTRKNIYNNPKTSISFSTNNSRVQLEDLNLNLSLQDNDCYEIQNVQKSLMGDSYSFEIIEKRPKLEEPLDTTFNLKISYDQEAFPFVFMTPDNVELEIINQGIRKADIMVLGRRNKPVEKISFKRTTYKEPFQGPFRWCRRYLEPTLSIPPYKWCVPDTAYTTMPVLISFNEEAIRSHSKIRFEMKGADDISSTHLLTYNNGKTEYLNAFAKPDTVDISVKILPGIPTTKFEGKIVACVENIDEINGIESTSNLMNVGTWSLKYKKGIPFFLWLLWFATVALFVFIIYCIVKWVVSGISSLAQSVAQNTSIPTTAVKQENKQPKKKSTNKKDKKKNMDDNGIFELEKKLFTRLPVQKKYEILEQIRFKFDQLYNKDETLYNEVLDALRPETRNALEYSWGLWNPTPNDGVRGAWSGKDRMTYRLSENNPYFQDCNKLGFTECTYDEHGSPDFEKVTYPNSTVDISGMYDRYSEEKLSQRGGGSNIQDEAQRIMSHALENDIRSWWKNNRPGEEFELYPKAFFKWRDSLDLVPHEDTNCTTMRLVSRSAHKAFTHRGGIANAINIKANFE